MMTIFRTITFCLFALTGFCSSGNHPQTGSFNDSPITMPQGVKTEYIQTSNCKPIYKFNKAQKELTLAIKEGDLEKVRELLPQSKIQPSNFFSPKTFNLTDQRLTRIIPEDICNYPQLKALAGRSSENCLSLNLLGLAILCEQNQIVNYLLESGYKEITCVAREEKIHEGTWSLSYGELQAEDQENIIRIFIRKAHHAKNVAWSIELTAEGFRELLYRQKDK